ncbi:MAG: hypothetical protein DWP97_09390, partial [Calditrichaeota bacterium]
VAQGGQIYAVGTPTEPIVFTTILDDVDNPTDIILDTTNGYGNWGGVIILGNATINTTTGVGQIEGIDPLEPRGAYGGADDDDNSGVFKYVSIRHGGTEIGAANEINGLTLGAVGRGTQISHVEIFMNKDDGVEWFGGTVNCDHLVAAYCGDDAFDYDEGFRGGGQFWFSIQRTDKGDRGGEHDGGTSPVDGEPFATPLISNATYLGRGAANGGQRCFEIRDNAGGSYMNSIFADHGTYGIKVEESLGEPSDSRTRLAEGAIYFRNNMWYGFGNGNTAADITDGVAAVEAALFTSGNDFVSDPVIAGVDRDTPDGTLDPRPTDLSGWSGAWIDPNDAVDGYNPPAQTGYPGAIDVIFPDYAAVDYPGAFDPAGELWICNWTALSQYGYLDAACTVEDCYCTTDDNKDVIVITDADISGFTAFSNENVYNLDGLVFVESGEELYIEPGTIIKGNTGQGVNSTALVVAQGGKIWGAGTHSCPIVFTTILDDVDNPTDIIIDTTNGYGNWGGVIILGNATINTTTGVGQIEGIDPLEPRGAYGGVDDDDNSGALRFASIRHGGTEIGAANEINGLTLGGVGRGTIISHVEIFMNKDDGVEWFGGTVNSDHLIAAYCGDDAFDYDEGFRGANQFLFAILRTDKGDRGGEHDGGTSPVDGEPFATPLFSNATYLGRGAANGGQRCFEIRDNAGGSYMNSIFADHGTYGIKVEESLGEPSDSRTRLAEGAIYFRNNMWYGFGNGNTAADITDGVAAVEAALFTSGNDFVSDPVIAGVDRDTPDGTLDPRPTDLSGWSGAWIDPKDGVDGFNPPAQTGYAGAIDVNYRDFEVVDYPGALDPNAADVFSTWLGSWTALNCYGYLGTGGTGGCCTGIRGNVDNDPGDLIDIADLVYLVAYSFGGGPAPVCIEEADVDASGGLDIGDIVYIVSYSFGGGPAPLACP